MGSTWTQKSKLVASNGQPDDWFGTSVDIEEGIVVVGAPFSGFSGHLGGVVYVFRSAGPQWTE
jgi:hypothetical protein